MCLRDETYPHTFEANSGDDVHLLSAAGVVAVLHLPAPLEDDERLVGGRRPCLCRGAHLDLEVPVAAVHAGKLRREDPYHGRARQEVAAVLVQTLDLLERLQVIVVAGDRARGVIRAGVVAGQRVDAGAAARSDGACGPGALGLEPGEKPPAPELDDERRGRVVALVKRAPVHVVENPAGECHERGAVEERVGCRFEVSAPVIRTTAKQIPAQRWTAPRADCSWLTHCR